MIDVIIIAAIVAAIAVVAVRYVRRLRAGGCGCGGGCDASSPVRPRVVADTNEAHYPYSLDLTVEGMHCEHCVINVENALNALGGVWARAELPGSAHVLGKEPIDRAACVAAIEAAGYYVAERGGGRPV